MNITRTLSRAIGITAAVVATTTATLAVPSTVDAYRALDSQPTIGCLAGVLELHGRGVLASHQGEQIYSMFDIYRWTGSGWHHEDRTDWAPLAAGPTTIAMNELVTMKQSGQYYTAVEHLARWDGARWQYDSKLTALMGSYAAFGTYYGSGHYARCS